MNNNNKNNDYILNWRMKYVITKLCPNIYEFDYKKYINLTGKYSDIPYPITIYKLESNLIEIEKWKKVDVVRYALLA